MPILRPTDAKPVGDYPFVGFNNKIGHRIVSWRPGFVEMTLEVQPDLLNAGGVVHGGVLMALLDSACGIASSYDENAGRHRWSMTLSFATQFIKAARGGRLTALGAKRGGGRSIFTSEAEILDENGDTVATGTGSFRYRDAESVVFSRNTLPMPD